MAPARKPSEDVPVAKAYRTGDLVWVRVRGFPWWPGQVMDARRANEKMLARKQPHSKLINTFGDNQHCWAFPTDMLDFKEGAKEHAKPTTKHKHFKLAVEEAKELADRRAGRTPATQHEPFDFLKMPEPEPAPPPRPGDPDWAPKPADAGDVRRADAAAVLSWLRALARHDLALLDQMNKEEVAAAESQLLSLMEKHMIRKKGRKRKADQENNEEEELAQTGRDVADEESKGRLDSDESGESDDEDWNEEQDEEEEALEQPKRTRAARGRPAGGEKAPARGKPPSRRRSQAVLDDDAEDEAISEDDASHEPHRKPAKRRKKQEEDREESVEPDIQLDEETTWKPATMARPQALLGFLRKLAKQPMKLWTAQSCTTRAACLLFRDKTFKESSLQLRKVVGTAALKHIQQHVRQEAAKPAKPAKEAVIGGKRKSGIAVAAPIVSETARFKEYADRVPATREEFMEKLEAFYAQRDTVLNGPSVDKQPLDLYVMFKAVAEHGGFEAVCLERIWRKIGHAWRTDLTPNGIQTLRGKYAQHLLAFENELSTGAPEREITRKPKAAKTETKTPGEAKAAKPKKVKEAKAIKAPANSSAAAVSAAAAGPPLIGHGGWVASLTGPLPVVFNAAEAARKNALPGRNSSGVPEPSAVSGRHEKPMGRPSSADAQRTDGKSVEERSADRKARLDAFDSLLDTSAPPRPAANKGALEQNNGTLAPLGESKTVVLLRFRPAYPLPSQSQISLEMRKYGTIRETRINPAKSVVSVVYASAIEANAALAALQKRAHIVWPGPPGSVAVSLDVNRPPRQQSGSKSLSPKTDADHVTRTLNSLQPQSTTSAPARQAQSLNPTGVSESLPVDPRLQAAGAAATRQQVPVDPRQMAMAPGLFQQQQGVGARSMTAASAGSSYWQPTNRSSAYAPAAQPSQAPSALPAPVLGHMDLESVLRNAGVQILSNLPMGSSPMLAPHSQHPHALNPTPALVANPTPALVANPTPALGAGGAVRAAEALSQAEGGSAGGGSADISGQVLSLLGQLQAPEPQ